jgi:hypothetical protein
MELMLGAGFKIMLMLVIVACKGKKITPTAVLLGLCGILLRSFRTIPDLFSQLFFQGAFAGTAIHPE